MQWALLVIALTCPAVWAEPGGVAIAARSGTLGLGGELSLNFLPEVNGRFGATFFSLDFGTEFSGVDYDFDLDILTFPISVDWYPFDGPFHVSAGLILNETEVHLDATASGSLTIGDTSYRLSDIGVLSGSLTFDRVAPYLGIGWGNAFGPEKRWGFMTDLGVAFIGSPDVALSASGPIAGTPGFQADLLTEERDIEDDLSAFKIYPVLSFCLFYRF